MGRLRSARKQLRLTRDTPDESGELARQGGDRLLLVLPAPEKLLVAPVQTMLSFPGDGLHLRRDAFIALSDRMAHGRSMPVAPSRFDQNASHVTVAGACDAPALLRIA